MSRRKPWFRLYSEIKQDRKLRRCNGDERWCWIVILCIASESPERGCLYITDGVPCNFEDIADEAALSPEVVEAAIFKFSDMNMMHQENGVWIVSNFLDRQYDKPSDRPEETKKRKQKSRECHADVTTHITDKQTNREQSTDISSCLTTTTGQCHDAVKGNELTNIKSDSLPQAEEADAIGKPTNQQLIAELTESYRAAGTIMPAKGDFAFIGALYNKFGYDQVLDGINKLQMAAAVQDLEKPLLYLKGILEKQKRDSPRNGGSKKQVNEDRKKMLRSLYQN